MRWAAGADYVTVVVLLLAAGADVDGRNDDDETPLHWAARNGRDAVVDALIAGGADVDAKDKDDDTPLHFAARFGRAAIVSLLIQATASLNVKNKDDKAPLHWAAEVGYPAVVSALIAEGADVNARDKDDKGPLHLADAGGHADIVAALIEAGAYWGDAACGSELAVNPAGATPPCINLHQAVTGGHLFAVNTLIAAGVDVNVTIAGKTPLRLALDGGHSEIAVALIAAGAYWGEAPCGSGLIANPEDPDPPCLNLIDVATKGHLSAVNALIAGGATVDVRDENEYTPLHWAARRDHVAVVNALIAGKADVDARGENDLTPLHWSASGGKVPAVIAALLAGGATADAANKSGERPLHVAMIDGRISMIAALITGGADVDARDNSDDTPLHWAAGFGHVPAVTALIAAKASLNVTGLDDLTPLGVAHDEGHGAVFTVILEAGGHWGTDCGIRSGPNPAGPDPSCVSCGELYPPQFDNAEACVPFAECDAPAVLFQRTNLCGCAPPNVGRSDQPDSLDYAPEPGMCDYPGVESCGRLIPSRFYQANTVGRGRCVLFAACVVPSVVNPETNLCDCPAPNVGTDGEAAPGRCAYPLATAAANATLLAEIRKTSPDLAVIRRALSLNADPNTATSDGIPALVVAATLLHAEAVSVLIAAGANPLVRSNELYFNRYNGGGVPRTIPEVLMLRHLRVGSTGRFIFLPSDGGRRLAETFIHFGDAAGDGFDWQAESEGGALVGNLVFSLVDAVRREIDLGSGVPPLEAVMLYLLGRGVSCPSPRVNLYDAFDVIPDALCVRPVCPDTSDQADSCSACARFGFPLRSGDGESCVSHCGPGELQGAITWPDGRCIGIDPSVVSNANARLTAEIVKISPDTPDLAAVREALAAGANPNITVNGRPALMAAGRGGHAKVVSVLVTAGANVNALDSGMDFAFHAVDRLYARVFPTVRAVRAALLYHFGDAIDARNAMFGDANFNWNRTVDNPRGKDTMLDILAYTAGVDTPFGGVDNLAILQEMADYAVIRGAKCLRTNIGNSMLVRRICNGDANAQALAAQAAMRASLVAEVEKAPGAAAATVVLDLLDEAGVHPNIEDSRGRPLLILAARNGHAEIVSVLITAGADVSATDPTYSGYDAAQHAAGPLSDPATGPRALRASVLYYFGGGLDVRNAASVVADFGWNREDNYGHRLLDLLAAAEDANPRPIGEDADIIHQMADYALSRGANCGDATADKTRHVCAGSPRFMSVRASLVAEVEKAPGAAAATVVLDLLDEAGVHPNIEDSRGRPLLILAARNGHAEIVSVLITAGADVNTADPVFRDFSAVHHAASPLVGENAGGGPGPRTLRASVLYYFVGGLDVRNAALGGAAFDWNREDASGFRPLDLLADSLGEAADAAERTLLQEMADYLIAQGGECGVKTADHSQLVCRGTLEALLDEAEKSAGAANVTVFLDLLENGGADPDYADSAGRPLLIVAARNGHAELVSVLAAAGANVNATDRTFFNRDVAHHAASTLSVPAVIPRGLRASVLYYFVGGLEVRNAASGGAKFNWNREDAGGNRALDLLADAEDLSPRPAGEDVSVIYQMADYMLLRGANCGGATTNKGRRVCAGSAKILGARTSLLAEVKNPFGEANVSVVLDLLDSGGVSPDIEDSEGTPILIVAAIMGHAEIVSVLVTAGADPEARARASICDGGSIGRAVPHVTAQNNFRPTLRYTWGTALNVLRHFADAVNQVGAPYDWNSNGVAPNCFNASRAIDYLRLRYDSSDASLPEEESIEAKRAAIGRMADILIFNGSSCEREANVNHVTCAGAARMSLVAEVSKPRDAADPADAAAVADLLDSEIVSPDVEDSEGTPVLIVAATLGHAEIVSVLVTAGADPDARLRASICGGGSIGRAVPHLTAQNNFGSSLYYPWETALTVLRHFAGAVNQVGAPYDWNSNGVDLDCATESRALDFLRPRYDDDGASLPEESVDAKRTAIGRMAGVLIANGASCENQANKDHVTCAGPSDSVTVEYGAIPRNQSGGTVIASVVSGGTTLYGTPLTFTATPAHGWELSAWLGEGDAAECPPSKLECALTAVSDLRVTALFSRAPSARYAPKPSNGGSVTVTGTDGVAEGVDFVYTGGTVTFTAIPAKGWEFSAWQGDADAAECPPSKLDCAVKVNGDLRVTALFSRAPSVRHAFEPSGGGSVTVIGTDGVTAEGVDFVYLGGTVTFTAIPAKGWELSVWRGDAASCPASEWDCERVANGDLRVTAIFAPASSVRYASEPSDGGRVTVFGTDGVAEGVDFVYTGGTVTFTAIPANGWDLSVWAGDAASCPASDWDCALAENGDLRVTAFFSQAPLVRHGSNPPDESGGRVTVVGTDGVIAEGVDFVYSGGTVTFTAIPAKGWGRAAWTGNCAGAVGNTCALFDVTLDVSVGATFMDINECAISTDNCAAEDDGGQCANTAGGFTCSCVAGYSGDGETCYSDKTVSFLPPANGTLSAAGGGAAIYAGQTATHGTTITFIAAPDGGYRLSAWLGDCAGEFDLSCKVMATVNVSVGAVFTNIDECVRDEECAADGGRCADVGGVFDCVCVSGHTGDGQTCYADKTVSFLQPANGTLSAADAGGAVEDGETTAHGTRLTFTAKPNAGWQIYAWLGDCVDTAATLTACEVTATLDVSVGVRFVDLNECGSGVENNCAPEEDGGQCVNMEGEFSCICAAGYSGDGETCYSDKTISFLPSPNGTISAAGGGFSFQDGNAAAHGTTVTFIAAPAAGYRLSAWLGDCAGDSFCEVLATRDVSVGATFIDIDECADSADNNCAAEADGGQCVNTAGDFTCICAAGYSGDGRACIVNKAVSFLPSPNGTISAAGGGVSFQDGKTAAHGTTITFTAAPAAGFLFSGWFGDCAGAASCEVTATLDVSVGATFTDINECGTSADICAAAEDGGRCINTAGGFVCDCVAGYSGDGETCDPDKSVLFQQSANGVLFAASGDFSIRNGGAAAHGTTITFTARPNMGYRISAWLGDCAGTAATVISCKAVATVDIGAGVTFTDIDECDTNTDDCAADGGICANTEGGFTCSCAVDYVGDGRTCSSDKPVSFLPSPNGALFAESGGVPIFDGGVAKLRARVTFIAAPDAGWQVSMWTGACAGTSVDASAGRAFCEVEAAAAVSVGAIFTYIGRCAVSGHLIFGAPPNRRCAPPTICPANYAGDNDCLPAAPAETGSPAPDLPAAANEPDACEKVFGGVMRSAGGGQAVCSNVDRNDTFCIAGSRAAFPCRGLFRHVWKCNTYNRPALNPFFCGARCAGGANMARGRDCGVETLDALQ